MHRPDVATPQGDAGVLAGVTLWRLAISACAFTGLAEAVGSTAHPWDALSQQSNLLAGVVYVGLAVYPLAAGRGTHEPRSPWLRGATTVLLLLVCVTYLTVIDGDLDSTGSLFEHLVTPLLVLADLVFVGRNQINIRWWHPLTWVLLPAAYLVYYLAEGLDIYGSFLDPRAADFPGVVTAFLVALVAAGYVLFGIAKARARLLCAN
jgi:hypothetical protein